MGDLEEIEELSKDMRSIRQKINDGVLTPDAEKLYNELRITNKRLMKLRNRN